ncbi:MAG: beta-ketoacyl-[acyl-carrier-protein] synthase family protein [Verrucomicrobiales bacterium]|jgi:3-oxoacyl-[acyl-carrier-protein] synthase II|nr:beta-ketoacyl-[acyl-carrier-protein] synthase family protein [Verrucomicrobiales bacterium]
MKPRIVISGIGVVSPYGIGREIFQQNICRGKSVIKKLSHLPYVGAGLALPSTSHHKSLQMALTAAQEAWNNSSIPANSQVALCSSIGWHEKPEPQPLANGENFLAGHFAISGPKISNFSACAASTMSIANACRLLANSETDFVLAGGADSRLHTLGTLGYSLLGALATGWDNQPERASRPFDRDRNGFVMGEGAAFFILERREQAEQRGVKIHGEILAHAANCDAYRLTDPNPDGETAAACIRLALERANLRPEQLDYINAHGTGTPANDEAEVQALNKALGNIAQQRPISSCKSLFGHLSMASGAIEIAASLLALRAGILPPTLNCENPAWPDFDFVPLTPRKTDAKIFLKNSFGFGGQNACLVVSL